MDPDQPVAGLGDGLMIASLPDEAIDALVSTAGTSAKCPLASVEVRHLGGEIGRHRRHNGALGSLQAPYLMFAAGIIPSPDLKGPATAAVEAGEDALAPWAAQHMYPELLRDIPPPGDTVDRACLPAATTDQGQRRPP